MTDSARIVATGAASPNEESVERAFRARVPTLPAGSVLIPALDAREDTP